MVAAAGTGACCSTLLMLGSNEAMAEETLIEKVLKVKLGVGVKFGVGSKRGRTPRSWELGGRAVFCVAQNLRSLLPVLPAKNWRLAQTSR